MKSYNSTYELLKLISSHVSSRSKFNKEEYVVTITDSHDISVDPVILVFPNIHNRKQTDKQTVLHHILTHHIDDQDNWKNDLLPGEYIYKLDVKRQRRQWMRIIYDASNKRIEEIRVTDK